MTKQIKKPKERITHLPCALTFAMGSTDGVRPQEAGNPGQLHVECEGDEWLHIAADNGSGMGAVISMKVEDIMKLTNLLGRGACDIWNARADAGLAISRAGGGA